MDVLDLSEQITFGKSFGYRHALNLSSVKQNIMTSLIQNLRQKFQQTVNMKLMLLLSEKNGDFYGIGLLYIKRWSCLPVTSSEFVVKGLWQIISSFYMFIHVIGYVYAGIYYAIVQGSYKIVQGVSLVNQWLENVKLRSLWQRVVVSSAPLEQLEAEFE